MALNQFTNQVASGWRLSSTLAKAGLALSLLILVGAMIAGTVAIVHRFRDAAYEKREEQRQAERQQLEDEKAQLQAEKIRQETRAAEAEAQRDAYKQVAESKRADRTRTIKELEQIENQHQQHKAEVEAAGGSMSDVELRRELCERLRARGYPPCPD